MTTRTLLISALLASMAACGGQDSPAGTDAEAKDRVERQDTTTESVGVTRDIILGDWSGTLEVPAGPELPLVFHITENNDGELAITLDSPNQGAMGIPGENARIEDGTFKAEFASVGSQFMAEIGEGETLKAVWVQGLPLPFTLERGVIVPELNRPQEPTERPYVIETVSFPGGADGVTLAGELTLPEGDGPFPAVILISGSGPQNRNEELMGHKPFLIISDDLTRKGYAVLRYDDRGVGESTGDHSAATTEDFGFDAAAAFAFLKEDARIDADRMAYVGHSEGGLIAPLAAKTEKPAAMVLLAGPSQTLADVAVYQTRELLLADGGTQAMADQSAEALEAALDLLRGDDDLDTIAEKTKALYMEAGLPEEMAEARAAFTASEWMRWVMDYDPVPDIAAFDGPVLALFGGLDKQVAPAANVADMEDALSHPASEVIVLEGLNHLFQPAKTGGMAEYATIEVTFDPAALDAMSTWLDENL